MSGKAEKTAATSTTTQVRAPSAVFFRKADAHAQSAFFGGEPVSSFFAPSVQPKLQVSQPDDPHEREAEAVADTVMTMTEPEPAPVAANAEVSLLRSQVSRQAGAGGFASALPLEAAADLELHAKADDDERPATPLVHRARGPPEEQTGPSESFVQQLATSRGSGNALPGATRNFMEGRFGADFADVRVHTGDRAAQLSRSISAQAFTLGRDIYFGNGKYNPDSHAGQHLLAHELTHTIQQGGARTVSTTRAARLIQRSGLQRSVQRLSASGQREAAVELAKGEVGKVSANATGPDGKRMGWERLLDYFRTTFGQDRVLPEGSAFQAGAVSEGQIKHKTKIRGDAMSGDGRTVLHNQERDAMPSWCGIFALWALNKGGMPMPPWQLGAVMFPPQAAYPPNHEPQPGDIAFRQEFSHFALVASADGSNVTSINGNTSGDDNLGGQIQVQTHPRDHFFAYFDPTRMLQGALRDPSAADAPGAAPTRSMRELRQQLFGVQRTAAAAPAVAAPTEQPELMVEEPERELAIAGDRPTQLTRSFASAQAQRAPMLARALMQPQSSTLPRTTAAGREAELAVAADSSNPALDRAPLDTRSRGPPLIQRSWLGDAWDAVSSVAGEAVAWVERGLDAAKGWLLQRVAAFVSQIPGYRMLSLILGADPITGVAVPLTGASLLEAGLDILPLGHMFRALLLRLGLYAGIATWLQGRIVDVSVLAATVGQRFDTFWNRLTLSDVGEPQGVIDRVAALLRSTVEEIIAFVTRAAVELLTRIKTAMVREISGFVRRRIPSLFPLLCVALGFDPETLEPVARNGTNLLHAFLEVSEEGREQRRQLLETGTFQRIASWIDRGIAVFSQAWTMLRAAISSAWDLVTIESLFSPLETLEQLYQLFAPPITLVGQFVIDAAIEIVRVIKDALLARLSEHAEETQGYSLLCVIIGRDPFTGVVVPRTVHNVVRGFMGLLDGGEAQYEQLQQSGAIDRILAKVEAAVDRLNMTPQAIIGLFIALWSSFSIRDLSHPIAAFQRIVATFGQPILRLVLFVVEIMMIVVEAILILMEFPFDLIANIVAKAREAWELIKQDPAAFFRNILRAIKQGFIQFFDNIGTHLLNGVTGWLMSELRDAGVPILTDFSLGGVISWLLEVFGLSMETIWQKLAEHPRIGQARVDRIRGAIDTLTGAWEFIRDVQERGISAIWERIQEQLTNLWDTVLDAVKNWIMERIVRAVMTRLLSMLDPTGIMAVVNSAMAIYRSVQSFIRYLTEMLQVINSFVEGVAEIAAGNVTTAADFLERSMDRAMPVVIGFLANQVGLSGVGTRIGEMVERAREMIDRALTWLVDRAVTAGGALLDRALALGRSAVGAVTDWWRGDEPFTANDGERHHVSFEGSEDSAVLMVRSTPQRYTTFLEDLAQQNLSADQQVALTAAQTTAREIDLKKRTLPRGPEKDTEIQGLKQQLARQSIPLFGSQRPNEDDVTLPTAVNGHTFATSMTARLIHNTSQKVSNLGSEPTHTPHDQYDLFDPRRDGGGSYYIRGHLLNHHLGGPGMWSNMTALSRAGNRNHETQVERRVKQAFDAGAVIDYEVRASARSHNTTDPTPNDKPRFTNIPDIDARFSDVQTIIRAERRIPVSLSCTASTMKFENGSWEVDRPIVTNVAIDNPIETDYASYDLGAGTRPPPTVDLNIATRTDLARLPGIGPARALQIEAHRALHGPFAHVDDLSDIVNPAIPGTVITALRTCAMLVGVNKT